MSGHSKRHNIKHKKAASDAKKAKVYTKLGKLIEIAARNGANPALNPSLESALIKARANNLPKDVIERAIKKGSGQMEGEQLEEIYYEGYGPGGTAIYIKCITSNTNRSGSDIRSILNKYNASMGTPGSVSWQFKEKGIIYIEGTILKKFEKGKNIEEIQELNMDTIEEDIIEADAIDYEFIDKEAKIIVSKENFINACKYFEQKNYKISESDLEYIAENFVDISDEDGARLERLIDAIDENEDVDNIYHNAN